jgi:hypothetical protein
LAWEATGGGVQNAAGLKLVHSRADCDVRGARMVMGIVAIALVGFAGVFTVLRRKNDAADAQAVKLGRLY